MAQDEAEDAPIETPEPGFPVSVIFERVRAQKTFNTRTEYVAWHQEELRFWLVLRTRVHDPAQTLINQLIAAMEQSDSSAFSTAEALQVRLVAIQTTYLPSDAGIGLIARNLSELKPEAAGLFAAEILKSNSISNLANVPNFEAKALATVASLYGYPQAAVDSLEYVIESSEQYQRDTAAVLKRSRTHLAECDRIWQEKFGDYAVQMALNAPKSYWEKRSLAHSKIAQRTKIAWWIFLVLSATLISVAAAKYLREDAVGHSMGATTTDLESAVRHLAIFGTILGFIVWFLRQLLRDARSHEHLAEDAAERVTMIETYSALKQAGLETEDLSPILAALYRPASTGLVDDTGPVTPIEIMMKGLKLSAGDK